MVMAQTVDNLPEYDVLEIVAGKLLNWGSEDDGWRLPGNEFRCLWNPFLSKDDAWLVIEALNSRGWLVCVKSMPKGGIFILGNCAATDAKLAKRCVVDLHWMGCAGRTGPPLMYRHPRAVWGDSFERAILNAALLVIALEEEETPPEMHSELQGSGRQAGPEGSPTPAERV